MKALPYLLLLAPLACSGAGEPSTSDAEEAADTAQGIKSQLARITRALTGEDGPFADKAYWLLGTQPDGTACQLLVARDDGLNVQVVVHTVGSNPPADMAFDLWVPTAGQTTPQVKVKSTSSFLQAAVNDKNVNGGVFSNNVEAHFAHGGGYAGLTRVRVFTDDDGRHVEAICAGLSPYLTLDRVAAGPGLARRAAAFYEAHHATNVARPVVLMGCGLDDAGRASCTFDAGNGDPEHDVPPDDLEVTFDVTAGAVGVPVAATLNGE